MVQEKGIVVDEATYKLLLEIQAKWGKGLHFKRVPKPTLEWFQKKADEEFEGDYGMLLKFLVDFYQGLIPENETLQALVEEINVLKDRVKVLEENKKQDEVKVVRASDGTILRRM